MKPLSKPKIFKIECDLYKVDTLFVLGGSMEELQKRMKGYGKDIQVEDGVNGTVLTFTKKPRFRCVWVEDPKNLNVIIHELLHLCTGILYSRGIPIIAYNPDGTHGDEPLAYLLEWFSVKVFKKLRIK